MLAKKSTLHITIIVITLLIWLAYWQFEDKIFRWLEATYAQFYATNIGNNFIAIINKLPFQSKPEYVSAALTNWLLLFFMNIFIIAVIYLSKQRTKFAFLLLVAVYLVVIIANVIAKKLGLPEKIIDETRFFFTYLASPLTVIYLIAYFMIKDKLGESKNSQSA